MATLERAIEIGQIYRFMGNPCSFALGINLLNNVLPNGLEDADLNSEHEKIHITNVEVALENLSEKQVIQLAEYGFKIREDEPNVWQVDI